MSCGPNRTCHAACDCREARWAAKLAAAEARIRELESRANAREAEVQAHMEARYAAEERARRLEEALRAEALLLAAAAGIQAVAEEAGRTTKASEVYQYLAFRLALLAPPPEAEKRGEG